MGYRILDWDRVIAVFPALFARPADAVAYAEHDIIGKGLAIVDATEATPIVVETASAHGLETGNVVTISDVGGLTEANGSWTITKVNATKFSLQTSDGAEHGPYTAGGVVGGGAFLPYVTFEKIARFDEGSGIIRRARIITDDEACVAEFRLHLFSAAPSVANDNSPFTQLWSNRASYLGCIDLPALETGGSGSDAAQSIAEVQFPYTCEGRDLFGVLEALSVFTPASGQQFHVEISADLN